MRVIVTGGAGYIGSHISLELLNAGHDVHILDNFSNADPNVAMCLRAFSGHAASKRLSLTQLDIRDSAGCTQLLKDWHPDAVIHLAGLKDVFASMHQPQRYIDVNVGGTSALLTAMDAANCNRLVFSSTAAVYGEPKYLPVDEAHPCHPLSPYGKSKLLAEEVLRDWVNESLNRSALVLRYFNPVGCQTDLKNDLMLPSGCDALMNRIVSVASAQSPALEVFGNDYDTPDGSGLRDFIHVSDLARAHVCALGKTDQPFQEINIGTGQGITVLQLSETFQRHTGRDIPIVIAPRRSGDLAASWADVTKASKVLGWRARLGYEEMCLSAWQGRCRDPNTTTASRTQNLSGIEYSTAR